MTSLPLIVFVAAIVGQARWPARRLEIVVAGGAAALLALAATGGSARTVLTALQWDVLIILGALGVVSRVLAESHVFSRLAVTATRWIGASPALLVPVAAVSMFLVSGLVNNITALVLVLPVVLAILQLAGTTARHLRWTMGVLLVACNLGGAATPVGDFPAVLLLGAGAMDFVGYLRLAFPTALAGLAVFLAVVAVAVGPSRDVAVDPLRRRVTVAVVEGLHARIRIRPQVLVPGVAVLGAMLLAWMLLPASAGVPPHLVAWTGAAALVLTQGRRARALVLEGVDLDATLFLFGLLVMVGAVRETGLFAYLARTLADLPVPPGAQLSLLIALAGVSTGLFSAGPSMAAMLEVARPLASVLGAAPVYVGLAFGVCAGSSLFLTAATSGPLAQSMVGRAGIVDAEGRRIEFDFTAFLPIGALAFAVILAVGIGAALWIAAAA